MKRNSFLGTFAALLLTPFMGFPSPKYSLNKTFKRNDKGFKITAGEGRLHGHMKLSGVNSNILDMKISGDDNDGAMAIFEQTSISQGRGTPMHVHHNQDEVFYVVDGKYHFQVGETKYDLSRGDSIFLPRKIQHAWTQLSKKGKMTVTFQPAGKMEEFFLTISTLDHEPSTEEIAEIFAANEMQVVGPPMHIDK